MPEIDENPFAFLSQEHARRIEAWIGREIDRRIGSKIVKTAMREEGVCSNWLQVSGAATKLGKSRTTVWRWLTEGRIPQKHVRTWQGVTQIHADYVAEYLGNKTRDIPLENVQHNQTSSYTNCPQGVLCQSDA